MFWKNLNNKRIGIWGMGKEGQSAKQALQLHTSPHSLIEISENNTDDIFNCDILIKSPGVSLYRPEIKMAKQKGIIITSGTNLFFANKKPETKIISVTGTKGKSTTSSLLAHTLKNLGQRVDLGGNIGVPLVDLVDSTADYIVAELSSYQCADLIGRPDIGVLVNLYPEHLPWHMSHSQYYQDKLNMIAQARVQILNASDERTHILTHADPAFKKAIYFNDEIHSDGAWFYDKTKRLFPCASLNLTGEHNQKNACAVLTVIQKLGLDIVLCENAFKTFQALPHRLQIVAQKNGLTFIDDSISTAPETAIAAMKAFENKRPITLLVGGQDRGQNYSQLIEYAKKHSVNLITLPDTGSRVFEAANQQGLSVYHCINMRDAVQKAINITQPNGIILLSPAAPSYNMYQNFEERGQDFKNCIEDLSDEQ